MAKPVSEVALENLSKYLKPPTIQQMREFIAELDVPYSQVERFYGIPYNMVNQIMNGKKNLHPKYWHFFYEKIIPAYGSGFIYKTPKKQKNTLLTNKLTEHTTFHGRIDTLKTS